MRGVEIRPLTGLRAVAATWVVVFHVSAGRPENFQEAVPDFLNWIGPVVGSGRMGVDLFFVLSGFVLALNYLDVMGQEPSVGSTRRFFWARLSRVWPAYFVMISIAGIIEVVQALLLEHRHMPDYMTGLSYLKQLFLVQQWTSGAHAGTSWDGPAWSVSSEALAYLLFPLLALAVARLARVSRPQVLFALSLAAMAPMVLVTVHTQSFSSPYGWVLRILCEFVAGMLVYTAVVAVNWTTARRRVAGWASVALAVAVLGTLYAAQDVLAGSAWGLTCVLFVPLIGLLSVASGPLSGLLGTRPMVFGGRISYSLYLVHIPTFHLFLAIGRQFEPVQADHVLNVYIAAVLVPVAFVFAWLLWRSVEEPCRRRMRDMTDRPSPVVSRHSETTYPVRVG